MPENQKQVVNLKDRPKLAPMPTPMPTPTPRPVPAASVPRSVSTPASAQARRLQQPQADTKKSEQISGVYNNKNEQGKEYFHKINRPTISRLPINEKAIKIILFILAAVIIVVIGRVIFSKKQAAPANNLTTVTNKWYSVKLVNGEIFYGKISNTSADPLVVDNVYYNYDQVYSASTTVDSSATTNSSLRLIKRGKETHGPEGSIDIVRTQVLYMEALKEDSKVLRAILEYEK